MRLDAAIRLDRGRFSLDVDFSLDGQAFGLAGETGSGKTSLLHALAGLLRPDSGKVALDDAVLFDSGKGLSVPAHKRGIGLVFQDGRLFPHLSVERNIRYALASRDSSTEAFFGEVADAFRLSPLLASPAGQLSGGERQRTAIARAIMAKPRVLLLDEPFSSQDRASRTRVTACIRILRDRWAIPIVLVSHDERDLFELTDHVLCLKGGKVVAGEALL